MQDEPRIIPGHGIGPFRVGDPGEPQVALLDGFSTVEERGTTRVIKTQTVSLFIEDGVLTQVGIHDGHPAQASGGLRLGMALGELEGDLLLDPFNEVLLLTGVAGLCFSTDDKLERAAQEAMQALEHGPTAVLSRDDRIQWIGVHAVELDSPEVVPVRLE